MPQPYIVFDADGAYVGRGMSFDPPGADGSPPKLPADAVACTQDEMNAAGSWSRLVNGAIVIGSAPVPAQAISYIPSWLVRQRLEAAGKWDAAVDQMSPSQQLKFATLQDGIDPADQMVIALLQGVGADPATILAAA